MRTRPIARPIRPQQRHGNVTWSKVTEQDAVTLGASPMEARPEQDAPPVLRVVEPGEMVAVMTGAEGTHLLLTDRRLVVATGERVALDVGFAELRRIQFDIERRRPATLVIVPEDPANEPQVVSVPPARYDEVTSVLATVGRRLARNEEAA